MSSIMTNNVVPAKAAAMTCSEAGVKFIKEYEGFRSKVYWDGGNAYIGYGTLVNSKDYPDDISREEADVLMCQTLCVKEESINKAMEKYGFSLTQNQFDALVSFTYNIGTGWMSSENRIFRYLKEGIQNYTDLEVVNAIGVWCHQGGKIINKLAERRLREAVMFLYGIYEGNGPHEYRYIKYDAGAGEVEHSMIYYEYGKPYGRLQEAKRSGYTLSGWVTGFGVKIGDNTLATENVTISAVWTEGNATVPADGYSDVFEDDWYYEYIVNLSKSGVLSGYEDGTFKPDNNVKLGEALKLILHAVGFSAQSPTGGHWASGYLALADSKGIADDTAADLDSIIDRQTVAEITAKSIGLPPLDPEPVFTDTQDGFILALYRCGIISGSGDGGKLMYYPQKSITRAELSTIIWKLCNSDVLPEQ